VSGSTAIANQALTLVGASLISSLTEGTENANIVNAIFNDVVKQTIAMGNWQTTIKRATLTQTTATPDWGYDYQFQLPTDPLCLIVLEVNDDVKGDIPWEISGDKLFTNQTTIKIRYVASETNIGILGPLLQMTIAHHLAWKISYKITGDNALANRLRTEFFSLMPTAMARDNIQGSTRDLSSDYLTDNVRL
jgi:hypothetical protein